MGPPYSMYIFKDNDWRDGFIETFPPTSQKSEAFGHVADQHGYRFHQFRNNQNVFVYHFTREVPIII